MIIERLPEEVTDWLVCFYPSSPTWWGRLIPGRFKHVALAAFCARADCWIFQEVCFSSTRTFLFPPSCGPAMIGDLTQDCAVLKFQARAGRPIMLRGPLTCVSFAAHVLGVGCVGLTCASLYRALIRNGATVMQHEHRQNVWRWWRWWD